MIFKNFEPTDVVEGRTTKVASGFWPDGSTYWSASFFESGFWELSNAQTPSTAFGSSPYDVRKTLYYTDIYPNARYKNEYKDPYFSITYGHAAGQVGSGSFDYETGSIKVSPTKAIYNQYKNILLGNADLDGQFTMKTGSTEVNVDSIFVINFSSYKTKDKIDEGVFEISLASPDGGTVLTLIDDSFYTGKIQSVYQLVTGSLMNIPSAQPTYQAIGLLYPNDGIVVFNASKLNELLEYDQAFAVGVNISTNPCLAITSSTGVIVSSPPSASYYTGSKSNALGLPYVLQSEDARYNTYLNADVGNQNNTQVFVWSLTHSQRPMVVRKSEYVPSRHYFLRVKNRDFNYSNNPTYVYDGKEFKNSNSSVKPPAGTIKNEDFYTDPRVYITTIGLYNDTNELVAAAKLSRPAVKTFDSELLLKIRLDF